MSLENMTVEEILQKIERKVQENPKAIEGLNATYMFHINGDDGGDYHVTFADSKASINEGESKKADCIISINVENFKKMIQGNLNATTAFMTGKIKVKGNMGLALKLESILKKLA